MGIEITLLGTGTPIPDPHRAGPATLVRTGDATFLVDCGRGVLMRLAAVGLMPPALDAVLLTHLHSDHLTDLGDVITTNWILRPEPGPLVVHGPPGTRAVVEATLAALEPDVGYRMTHHADLTDGPRVRVVELEPGAELRSGETTLHVRATDHRPVAPTVGYRFEHGDRAAAIAGDTVPCEGLDELCRGADVYVQTVVREDLVRAIPSERLRDVLDYHSTVEQAADTATRAGVSTLVLTHYVPGMAPGTEDEWRSLAAGFPGEVVAGDDLMTITA